MTRAARRGGWIAGLVVGVAAGVLSLELPILGWAIGLAFAVPAVVSSSRVAAVGGLLCGIGATWLGLLVHAALECRAFDAAPGQGCVEPDLSPWLVVGAAMLVTGVVLTIAAAVRSRRAGPGAP